MRKFYTLLAIISCAAITLCYIGFFRLDEYESYPGEMPNLISILVFLVIFVISLFYGTKRFKNTSRIIHFLPAFLSILFSVIIVLRALLVNSFGDSPSQIKAFGGRHRDGIEVFRLDFKKNGYLLVDETYGFWDLYYWGKYQRSGDTIFTHIKKHEIQFDTIVLKQDTLLFLGDTNTYWIEHY